MTRTNTYGQARLLGAIFALLLLAASGTILLTATATAQTGNETSSPGTQIDSDLSLLESSYNSSSGYASLRFRTDTPQAVTLADAADFQTDGEVDTKTVVLEGDGEQTIRFNVSEYGNGRTGVSISTGAVLFSHTISKPSPGENPLEQVGPLAGWFGGALAVASMTSLAAYRRINADPDAPEDLV